MNPMIAALIMKVIFSGIQSTGTLHLGNYLGAVRTWITLQQKTQYQRFYSVVDHHAITNRIRRDHSQASFDREVGRQSINLAKMLLACGIDPNRSCLFLQSSVPQHVQLFWILGSITPLRLLSMMTQFKAKSNQSDRLFGLYSYPILMAADILLYKANLVPIGEDQVQHLQFTKQVCSRMNKLLDLNFPKPQYKETGLLRVLSLKDGMSKMSKSDSSDNSRINLTDSSDLIRNKINKAKTDSLPGVAASEDRPELSNLIRLYYELSGISSLQQNSKWNDKETFKEELAQLVVKVIQPIRTKYSGLQQQKVKSILKEGRQKARSVASANLKQIKSKVGYCTLDNQI